jgi:hypothetical protein
MAKYLLLIYGDEQFWDARTAEDRESLEAAHAAFAAAAGTRLLGGYELRSGGTARTLRANPTGPARRTDGPFLETKEVIGGYYVLEAADLAEATALAELLPELREPHGAVEVRPIV